MKQYQDICENIELKINVEDDAYMHKRVKLLKTIQSCDFIVLVGYFYLVIAQNPNRKYLLILFLLLFGLNYLGYVYLNRYAGHYLMNDCDTKKAISLYSALCKYVQAHRWSPYVYDVAASLYYDGRYEDVVKIIPIMERYAQTDFDHVLIEILYCKLAHHNRDLEGLAQHISILRPLGDRIHLHGIWKHLYFEILEYWELLELEVNKKYKRLYKRYQTSEAYEGSVLNEVKKHYHLAMISNEMNNKELMLQHKEFVLQHGGTLWYKKRLEEIV